MKNRLEMASNLAVIILCTIVGGIIIEKRLNSSPQPIDLIKEGQILTLDKETPPLDQVEMTLFIALSPRCSFCTESIPFYKSLTSQHDPTKYRMVALVGKEEHVEEERAMLENSDIAIDTILSVDFPSIGIPGTPTLLLVNPQGKVLKAWPGKLNEATEQEVFRSLGLLS